jgi:glycosyltransferase involved in cell wall biosynthesis
VNPFKIALCGPVSLDLLSPQLSERLKTNGYAFPMTAHLAREYVRRGHAVAVVTTATDITRPVSARVHDALTVTVLPSRPRARDRALDLFRAERRQVAEALERWAPDAVHAHWSYEFGLGAQESGLPVVVTVHDWAPAILRHARDAYRAARMMLQFRVLSGPGVFTAPSPYIADRVKRWFRHDCRVVPNAVPLANVHFEKESSGEQVVSLLNAADGRRKNIRTALMAWPRVLSEIPAARMRLGGGPFAPCGETHRWAASRGLDHRVEFAGPVDPNNVPNWLSQSDVFLHPSLEESFGNVLIEAMGAGVPVIAGRDSGAVPFVVGNAGLLVDVRSADAIADALIGLMRDADDRSRLRALGVRNVRRFTIEEVADSYLDALAESRVGRGHGRT